MWIWLKRNLDFIKIIMVQKTISLPEDVYGRLKHLVV
jgi:hypothetical protein